MNDEVNEAVKAVRGPCFCGPDHWAPSPPSAHPAARGEGLELIIINWNP